MANIPVTSMLIERLEHIPADSIWAHRASGVRGALIRLIESLEVGDEVAQEKYVKLYDLGFQLLEEAAREKY